jgi:hypothetical protein
MLGTAVGGSLVLAGPGLAASPDEAGLVKAILPVTAAAD